jgi:hypothetical protein
MLKRLPLFFAALTLGLAFAGWVTLRVLAGRVLDRNTEPVRRMLVADWERHAEQLENDLALTRDWSELHDTTPPALGCQLQWRGEARSIHVHLERCAGAPGPLGDADVSALKALGDQLLVKAAEAPAPARDLSWMASLRGHDDWTMAAGTPNEFLDPTFQRSTAVPQPQVDGDQLEALARLRLAQGQRAGALEAAVDDVTALARALLGRPFFADQHQGLDLLALQRRVLDGAGRTSLGTPPGELAALQRARLASAMLWHPWAPKLTRERFLARLHAASRCAAIGEALEALDAGPLLAEQYPDFTADFAAWQQSAACRSDALARMVAARRSLPEHSWRRLLPTTELVERAERGEVLPAFLLWSVESMASGRKAMMEVILSVTAARPFLPGGAP